MRGYEDDPKGVKRGANHEVPLRGYAAPSYDPFSGRASSNFSSGKAVTIEDEHIRPSTQMGGGQPGPGSPSWSAINTERSRPRGGRVGRHTWGGSAVGNGADAK